MIKLHLKDTDAEGSKIRHQLEELCLAFEIKTYPNNSGKPLPAVEEGNELITEKKELDTWLNNLRAELTYQRSLSGDGCYIDPETGEVC